MYTIPNRRHGGHGTCEEIPFTSSLALPQSTIPSQVLVKTNSDLGSEKTTHLFPIAQPLFLSPVSFSGALRPLATFPKACCLRYLILSDNYHIILIQKTPPTALICRELRNFPLALRKADYHIIFHKATTIPSSGNSCSLASIRGCSPFPSRPIFSRFDAPFPSRLHFRANVGV